MVKEREYIRGFDLLKFIMALVIISLHSELSKSFEEPISDWVLNFQNLAVPIFFVLSAILFFDKVNLSENPRLSLLQFEKRVFILYAIWSIIMIPITLRYHNYVQEGLFGFLLFVKDFFFDYTFLASWFLGALLVSVPIAFALRRHPVILLLLSVLIYAYYFMLESLPVAMHLPYDWYHSNIGSPERSFLCGIVWVGIGCVLSTKKVLFRVKAVFANKTRVMIMWGGYIIDNQHIIVFRVKRV